MIDAQSIAAPSRRGFVAGALALLAAPVVVKAASLMRVAPTEIIRPTFVGFDPGGVDEHVDVLFGSLRVRPEWAVTIEAPLEGPPRQFVITEEVQRRADRLHLTINQITREAVQRFQNSNTFIKNLNEQYERDFAFMQGQQWKYNAERRSLDPVVSPMDKLALAVAAPVVVAKALEQPVTRRLFFGKRSA